MSITIKKREKKEERKLKSGEIYNYLQFSIQVQLLLQLLLAVYPCLYKEHIGQI